MKSSPFSNLWYLAISSTCTVRLVPFLQPEVSFFPIVLTILTSQISALHDTTGPLQTLDHLHIQGDKRHLLNLTLDTFLLQSFLVQWASSTPKSPPLTWGTDRAIPALFYLSILNTSSSFSSSQFSFSNSNTFRSTHSWLLFLYKFFSRPYLNP